jgi:TPR repeat protein
VEGDVFVAFTVLPDGRARIPRVILEMPPGIFGAGTRESVLRDSFAPLPAGSPPVQCVSFYRYTMGVGNLQSLRYDYPQLVAYAKDMHRRASAGDPNAQLIYGMLLVGLPQLNESSGAGLPWFVRAAQAGIPLAQFEVGYSLLMGLSCQRDAGKAVTWLRMAADQNEPNAEVTLAMGAMRGAPGFGDAAQTKDWLEKAAAQGNYDGELYLAAFLAAATEPGLRDPQRALGLLHEVMDGVDYDPTPYEIRAAAQAAQGDFSHAVSSEKSAIGRARFLGWDLAPLRARLADYQAHKAWYGDLLEF